MSIKAEPILVLGDQHVRVTLPEQRQSSGVLDALRRLAESYRQARADADRARTAAEKAVEEASRYRARIEELESQLAESQREAVAMADEASRAVTSAARCQAELDDMRLFEGAEELLRRVLTSWQRRALDAERRSALRTLGANLAMAGLCAQLHNLYASDYNDTLADTVRRLEIDVTAR